MKVSCLILTVILITSSTQGENPSIDNDQKKVLGFLANKFANSQLLKEKIEEAKKKVPSLTQAINGLLGGDLLDISNSTLKFNSSALGQAFRPHNNQNINVEAESNEDQTQNEEGLNTSDYIVESPFASANISDSDNDDGIETSTKKSLDEPDTANGSFGTSSTAEEQNNTSSDDINKPVPAKEPLSSSVEDESNSGELKAVEGLLLVSSQGNTDTADTEEADVDIETSIDALESEKDSLIAAIAKDLGEIDSDIEVFSYARTLLFITTNWLSSLFFGLVGKVFYLAYIIIVPFPVRWLIKLIAYLI